MITMIETMNNYDELASKAKAKADAIREAIKEEMVRQNTEELVAGAYIVRLLLFCYHLLIVCLLDLICANGEHSSKFFAMSASKILQ